MSWYGALLQRVCDVAEVDVNRSLCPRCSGVMMRDRVEDDGTWSCVACGHRAYPQRVMAFAQAAQGELVTGARRRGPKLRGNRSEAA
jgi:hypothetical protein